MQSSPLPTAPTIAHALRLRLLALAAPLLLAAVAASAQFPGLPRTLAPQAAAPLPKPSPGETTDQARARLRTLLDDARAQVARPPLPLPAGIAAREGEEMHEARLKLVVAYDVQLRTLEQLDQARASRVAAEAGERAWTGFDTPPPYTIFRVDELRDAADVERDRIALLESGVARLKLDAQRAEEDYQRASAEGRRADEALASASGPEDQARAAWQLDFARTKGQAAAAATAAGSLITSLRTEELATRRAALKLLERQIALAAAHSTFSEADLATARRTIDERIEGVRQDLATLEAQAGKRAEEREAAKTALARLQSGSRTKPDQLATAQARLDAADAWVAATRDESDALQGLVVVLSQMAAAWGARYAVMEGNDAEAKRLAADQLREAAQRSADWKAYAESLVHDARTKLADVEAKLADTSTNPATVKFLQDALAARRGAVLANERLQSELESTLRQLTRWQSDLNSLQHQRDVHERLVDAWLELRDGARAVWNFELFEVEDSTVADGQPVTVSRGVTVGKSVGALLIFLLGYWLIAAIARRVERRLVGRGFDAARVRTAKRWLLALVAVLLLLLTLNLAKIPFTVFAFLGGALAIGVGFGTQTLIKNLVSGMVVLMERNVRVGDIVEVENFSGTVTEVNLRSSTIRGFDGVEAIIPNAVFVESKVTNWTQSDRRVRRIIKVSVAYGSPTRQVAELLVDCARRHGLVLADPPPLALFDDFGDSALVFALYLWVELRPAVSSPQVMSDIRFMIEKAFADAGIVMPFPQRDVNLRTGSPLQVEVVPEHKGEDPLPT